MRCSRSCGQPMETRRTDEASRGRGAGRGRRHPTAGPDAGGAPGASPATTADEEAGRSGDDGPPEAAEPARRPARRTGGPDRHRALPPAQALAPGRPERPARPAAGQGDHLVDRPPARRDRAARLLRHRSAARSSRRPPTPGPRSSGSDDDRPSADALVGHRPRAGRVGRRSAAHAGWPTARAWRGPRSRWLPSTSGRPSGSGRASGSSDWPGDHVVAAFSLGIPGRGRIIGPAIEWVAVAAPDESPCPDCEDNGLNGAQAAGEEFPTGHPHPPAHPGCRCLLAPSTP